MAQTIPHLAQDAARRFGAAAALVEDSVVTSFAGLWDEARAAASAFLADRIGRGDRIAVWAPNRREWIATALGAQCVGAAIVPLNTRLKGREASDILRRARCRVLMTVGQFLGADYCAMLDGQDLPDLRRVVLFDRDWREFLSGGRGADDPAVDAAISALRDDDVSDIMFTSGTTGAPKGVVSTHSRVAPMFRNWTDVVDLREGDRYLIVNPFFHSFGYKAGWVASLIKGAAMFPMPAFDAERAAKLIETQAINFLPGPPTIYQSLLGLNAQTRRGFSSLRVAVTGAAVVPPRLVERMQSELGFKTVITGYGMTECGAITMCRAGDPVELISSTCGRAMPGLDLKCVDDAGRRVAPGDQGEILVRGYGVMQGYLDDPAATAEAIDADGWLHTGDVGALDPDGYLRIIDRKKDMYISGGFNCYPAEIENLICSHPSVEMAAVIGVPDERLGEVGKAFVVLRPDANVSEPDLIAWARANMANYKAPRSVAFMSDLPKNASGKVLKAELRSVMAHHD